MQKHARISESDHICNIEDEGKHDDGDKSVKVSIRSWTTYGAICSTDDRLNLSRETKKRPSQRAGKTYSAVQNSLDVVLVP
jgi:hypothetical protein